MPGEKGDLNHGVVLVRFWSTCDAVDGKVEVFFEFMLP
jgi:hypothetical protein